MALQSVPAQKDTTRIAKKERVDLLACKARAIVDLISVASYRKDELEQDSIAYAAWAVSDMIEEMRSIVGKLAEA